MKIHIRFYPPPQAVMVVPIYDKREAYRSRSWSPSDDDRRGYREYSRDDSDHDSRYGGRSHRGHRDEYQDDPRQGSRRDRYRQDDDTRHYPRSASHGRYHDQPSEAAYSSYGPERGDYSDLSRARPPGQGPAHPMSVTGHINPQSSSHSPSSHGQQAQYQQAHSSSAHGKPSRPGFLSSMLGAALSQGSHSPSQIGHAAFQGAAHSQSQSHGGHGQSADLLQGMNLPPATRALLKFAQERGILDELTNYFKAMPPSRDFAYSKCTGKKKAVCVSVLLPQSFM